MGASRRRGAIRLTVPAEPDFVQVVRVAVRIASGRMGFSSDARSRLQASAGATFFEALDRSHPGASIVTEIVDAPERVEVSITSTSTTSPLDPTSVAAVADGYELTDEGATLRVWVDRA